MVRFMKIAAVAGGALILSALPVYAQNVLGIDLDPFHIFTPAPPPPASAPVAFHHHGHYHHGHHHHGHHTHKH